jgi:hypothetical protein
VQHSADDDTVELVETTPANAEVVAARLRSENIKAVVFGGDGDLGYGPFWSSVVTARVMVRRGDLQAAAVLLSDLFPEAV